MVGSGKHSILRSQPVNEDFQEHEYFYICVDIRTNYRM